MILIQSLTIKKIRQEKAQNLVKIQTYWLIGERICREFLKHKERAEYGKRIILFLSEDLNISITQIKAIIRFYRNYPIIQNISSNLTWSHYYELTLINDHKVRQFYEVRTLSNRWSIRQLRENIRNKEHEKISSNQSTLMLSNKKIPSIYEVIKDKYNFNFLELNENYTEQDIEQNLLNHISIVTLGS